MASTQPSKQRGSVCPPACAELEELFERRNQPGSDHEAVDREIRRKFQRTRAVLILDMAGFSISVQRHGIIHHLAKIHRMRVVVADEVRAGRGRVVKFEADNAFVTFANVAAAVRSAIRINEQVARVNQTTPPENQIEVAIGIGYGPILLACDDFYGDEVNLASKLGEDIAQHGEVLLTGAASKALKPASYRFKAVNLTISGVHLKASRLVF